MKEKELKDNLAVPNVFRSRLQTLLPTQPLPRNAQQSPKKKETKPARSPIQYITSKTNKRYKLRATVNTNKGNI